MDGSHVNPIRDRALKELEKTPDDYTTLEDLQRATDDYWFTSVAIEKLHRLPEELEDIGMSSVCTLRAYGIVKAAYDAEIHEHIALTRPKD